MATIDPKGGNSNVVTDYDVMLDALSNGYPDALAVSFGGDKKPLDEVTAELDKRQQEIEDWLADVKAAEVTGLRGARSGRRAVTAGRRHGWSRSRTGA